LRIREEGRWRVAIAVLGGVVTLELAFFLSNLL
jgi:hypothetical protein